MKVKLNLTVRRNGLPPTTLRWAAEGDSTISELLGQVNGSLPLESPGWGLEDYVVEASGAECLHYHEVSDILNEGEDVV